MTKKIFVPIPLKNRIETYRLKRNTSKKIKRFTKKQKLYKQKLDLMSYREDFNKEIKKLRDRYNIPPNGFSGFTKIFEWSDNQDQKKYNTDLNLLMKKFNIAFRWQEAIEYYLLFNKTDVWLLLPYSVGIKMMEDPDTGNMSLYLQIYKDTKAEDIKLYWKSIQLMKGLIKPYREEYEEQGITRFISRSKDMKKRKDRKFESAPLSKRKRAYELNEQGFSYKEIGKEIGCMYYEVGNHIKRFKEEIDNVKLD